jgi:hypothetical protein
MNKSGILIDIVLNNSNILENALALMMWNEAIREN